jgi:hypothetical protein
MPALIENTFPANPTRFSLAEYASDVMLQYWDGILDAVVHHAQQQYGLADCSQAGGADGH